MNPSKAREFFSSYFEGTLDTGLCQAFERTLRTDAELQAEYRAFEQTMDRLGSLKETQVEIPFDLRERIAARLDLHVYEQKHARRAPWISFWRPIAIGALGALAIIGTVLSLNRSDGERVGANVVGDFGSAPKRDAQGPGQKVYTVHLDQIVEGERLVTITNALTGTAIGQLKVSAGDNASIEIKNSDPGVSFSKIQIQGESAMFIAVPGKASAVAGALNKDATIRGAAMRLASRYAKPVVVLAKDPLKPLAIVQVTAVDPVAGAGEALGEGCAVELRPDGFIWVQEH